MRLMNPAYAPQQMNINDKPPQMPASFQPTAPVLTDQRQTAGLPVPVPSNQTASTGQGFFDFPWWSWRFVCEQRQHIGRYRQYCWGVR